MNSAKGKNRSQSRGIVSLPFRREAFSVWEGLVLLIALGGACYFRFVDLDATWMSPDQSTLLSLAMDIAEGKRFPLAANQSSAGIAHPALSVYLYAIPMAISHRAVSAAILTSLLNVLSVGISYLYARRFLGRITALIFLALYAASPWSVHFSRLIWNPVMIPFFVTLALWLLTCSVSENAHPAAPVGTALLLMGILHSHLVSLPILASTGIIWLLFHRRIRFWPAILGGLLIVLSFIPYLLAHQNPLALFHGVAGEEWKFNMAPLRIAGDLVSGRGLFLAAEGWKTVESLLQGWLWVSLAWLGGLTLRYIREAWQGTLSSMRASRIVLFFWSAIPLVALMPHRHYLQHHYFLFLYPAIYLAMAALAGDIGSLVHRLIVLYLPLRAQRIGFWAGLFGFLSLIIALFGWSFFVSDTVLRQERLQTCPQERHLRAALDIIRANLDQFQIRDLVVLSDGIDASYSTFGFIGHFLPEQTFIRFTRLGNGLPVPITPALYLVAGDDPRTTTILDQVGRLLNTWDIGPCGRWKLYITPGGLSFAAGTSGPIGEWANGLQLWGYQVERVAPGEGLLLTSFWRVTAERPLHWDYFFFHLFSPSGEFISQMDGPGVSSPYWRKGDWLILLTTLSLPSGSPVGRYEIYCGLYSWPDLERIPVIAGEATDNRLRLAEVQIP